MHIGGSAWRGCGIRQQGFCENAGDYTCGWRSGLIDKKVTFTDDEEKSTLVISTAG